MRSKLMMIGLCLLLVVSLVGACGPSGEECHCEELGAIDVTWLDENGDPMSNSLHCNDHLVLTIVEGGAITVNATNSVDCPAGCAPSAHWQITESSSGYMEDGNGFIITFEPDVSGSYLVEFDSVACGVADCKYCCIILEVTVVTGVKTRCVCGEWTAGSHGLHEGNVSVIETWTPPTGVGTGMVGYYDCDETITITPPGPDYSGTVHISSDIACVPDGCADVVYTHYVTNPDGVENEGLGNSVELIYGPPYGVYTVVLNASCGDVVCSCTIYLDFEEPCEPKMTNPQYPDEDGWNDWDVYSCQSGSWDPMIQVADDWECSETGLITDIRFWGSWKGDEVGDITGFWVEIYENNLDYSYSQPGELLWRSFITDFSSELIEPDNAQGWYNPLSEQDGLYADALDSDVTEDHDSYYRYDISDIEGPFCQEKGTVYWLSVYAIVDGYEVWGWKSSEDHWEDSACWSTHLLPDPQDPVSQYSEYDWYEVFKLPGGYPATERPKDMAFIICGGEPCERCRCQDWGTVQVYWVNQDQDPVSWPVDCGSSKDLTSFSGEIIEVDASNSIGCTSSCEDDVPDANDVHWQVTGDASGDTFKGDGLVAQFVPVESESYLVEFENVYCDGVECEDCNITLNVDIYSLCGIDGMIVPSLVTNTELYECTGCHINYDYYVEEVPPSQQATTWNQDLVTDYGAQWLFCMACCSVYHPNDPTVPGTGDKIYTFLTSFEIPQDCLVDSATLKITADDFVTEIRLNGNPVDLTNNPCGTADSSAEEDVHNYLIDPSWFVPGGNMLTVELKDCFDGVGSLCGSGLIGGIWCLVIDLQ